MITIMRSIPYRTHHVTGHWEPLVGQCRSMCVPDIPTNPRLVPPLTGLGLSWYGDEDREFVGDEWCNMGRAPMLIRWCWDASYTFCGIENLTPPTSALVKVWRLWRVTSKPPFSMSYWSMPANMNSLAQTGYALCLAEVWWHFVFWASGSSLLKIEIT